jgi:hypothetical protein
LGPVGFLSAVGANLTLGLVLVSGIRSASWSGELEKMIGNRVGVLGLPGGSRSIGKSRDSGPGSWGMSMAMYSSF